MAEPPHHVVVVIGGAVSGSVAAELLADHGVEVVVIDQNDRPYGKIEDGLPRWHVEQRRQEYERIDARLNRAEIRFVPRTRLGRDLSFDTLAREWGASAVVLANGAWRDRPLPVDGAETFLGRGLAYQNAFIYWFNHHEEADYSGPRIDVPDNAVVIGGGLASLDVAKACQIVLYRRALQARGLDAPIEEMEAKGISAVCARLGVDATSLGIAGALLLYRRRVQDMPLAQPPDNATPAQIEKTQGVREKILARAQEKYGFRVQDLTTPLALVGEGGILAGLRVQRNTMQDGRVTPVAGSESVLLTSLVISSIGSIPEPIEGVEMRGETYAIPDQATGAYEALPGVFAVGNVVTGQGNIRSSLLHARQVVERLVDEYLAEGVPSAVAAAAAHGEVGGVATAEAVRQHLVRRDPLTPEQIAAIRSRVRALQDRAGYDGDYAAWIAAHPPVV